MTLSLFRYSKLPAFGAEGIEVYALKFLWKPALCFCRSQALAEVLNEGSLQMTAKPKSCADDKAGHDGGYGVSHVRILFQREEGGKAAAGTSEM